MVMQRIGRVNRIGTKADEIYIFNFYPTGQSNELIELNEKALKKLQGFHSAFGEDSKIYSDQEELIDNILGELQPKEEVDERLMYLEIIRELHQSNPSEYKRLKQLPAKSRVTRLTSVNAKIATEIVGKTLENASLCYLRNSMKEGFYVTNGKHCTEITFIQAARLFEASLNESAQKSNTDQHHFESVQTAINQFKSVYNAIFSIEEYDTSNLSVQERNAVLFLKAIIELKRNFPNEVTDEFEDMLKAALKIIYMGVFRKFRNEMATLAAKQKKKRMPLDQIIAELNVIMNKYPIRQIARMDKLKFEEEEISRARFEDPKIVLTETFA